MKYMEGPRFAGLPCSLSLSSHRIPLSRADACAQAPVAMSDALRQSLDRVATAVGRPTACAARPGCRVGLLNPPAV
jgi:hypothetical protein